MTADSLGLEVGSTSLPLIRRLQAGERESWTRFVRLYYDLIRRWCHYRGVTADALDDVVQEVLLGLVRSLPGYRDHPEQSQSFRRWLLGVVRHKVADHFRKAEGDPIPVDPLAATWLADELDAAAEQDSDEFTNDEWSLLARKAVELVHSEFDHRTWEAFRGTVMDGRPAADVAAELGVLRNVVYLSKSRVLRRLREVLQEGT
jgi:RNA polymerase sigma-70 factor (ECF subfamily)